MLGNQKRITIKPYEKLTLTELGKKELQLHWGTGEISLLYAITTDGWLITPSQRLLERTIDRQTADKLIPLASRRQRFTILGLARANACN